MSLAKPHGPVVAQDGPVGVLLLDRLAHPGEVLRRAHQESVARRLVHGMPGDDRGMSAQSADDPRHHVQPLLLQFRLGQFLVHHIVCRHPAYVSDDSHPWLACEST
jgi:hypothetical protein